MHRNFKVFLLIYAFFPTGLFVRKELNRGFSRRHGAHGELVNTGKF